MVSWQHVTQRLVHVSPDLMQKKKFYVVTLWQQTAFMCSVRLSLCTEKTEWLYDRDGVCLLFTARYGLDL